MLSLGIAGSPDQVVERCRGLGAEHISFGTPLGPDLQAAVRILGRDVIPRLKDSASPLVQGSADEERASGHGSRR